MLVHFTPYEHTTLSIWHLLPPWQPSSYLILSPLNKYPLTLTPPYPLGSSNLNSFYPLWTHIPSLVHYIYPIGSPTLKSFYPSWTNNPLTLTQFYPLCQLNTYLKLTPLNKLPLQSYTILPPWQPSSYLFLSPLIKYPLTLTPPYPLVSSNLNSFYPLCTHIHSLVHYINSIGSPTLESIYPLWTNYPLTFTPIYPLGSPVLTSF